MQTSGKIVKLFEIKKDVYKIFLTVFGEEKEVGWFDREGGTGRGSRKGRCVRRSKVEGVRGGGRIERKLKINWPGLNDCSEVHPLELNCLQLKKWTPRNIIYFFFKEKKLKREIRISLS